MKQNIHRMLMSAHSVAEAAARRLKRVDRAVWSKMGFYAALAALLILLGSASQAYRNRGARTPSQTPSPRAVSAFQPFAAPSPAPTEPPALWVWPLDGDIIGDYVPQTLVWSATLGQWQTHPAVDIAGNPGEAVRACADGVVIDAWKDALWGNVIQIEHPDGSLSTYANLNTLNLVQVGQKVAAGDIISAVGQSASCESDMPWHLHFSVERDGAPVDPAQIIPGG